jgi:hypothetical protein
LTTGGGNAAGAATFASNLAASFQSALGTSNILASNVTAVAIGASNITASNLFAMSAATSNVRASNVSVVALGVSNVAASNLLVSASFEAMSNARVGGPLLLTGDGTAPSLSGAYGNLSNTYLILGSNVSTGDASYLRNIGGNDSQHLVLDMYDEADCAFSVRNFDYRNNSNVFYQILTCTGGGPVGVGTSNPAARLEVLTPAARATPPIDQTWSAVAGPAGFQATVATPYYAEYQLNGQYRVYAFPETTNGWAASNMYISYASTGFFYEYSASIATYSTSTGLALTNVAATQRTVDAATLHGNAFAVEFPSNMTLHSISITPRQTADFRRRTPRTMVLCSVPTGGAFPTTGWTSVATLTIDWDANAATATVPVEVPITVAATSRYALVVTAVGAPGVGYDPQGLINVGRISWNATPAASDPGYSNVALRVLGDVTFGRRDATHRTSVLAVDGNLSVTGRAQALNVAASNLTASNLIVRSTGNTMVDVQVGNTATQTAGITLGTAYLTSANGAVFMGPNVSSGGSLNFRAGNTATNALYMTEATADFAAALTCRSVATSNILASNALIGRAAISNFGVDWVSFGHNASTQYAILQGSTGDTFINSSNIQPIYFRHNNINQGGISNGRLGMGTTSPTVDVEFVGKANSNHQLLLRPALFSAAAAGQCNTAIAFGDAANRIYTRFGANLIYDTFNGHEWDLVGSNTMTLVQTVGATNPKRTRLRLGGASNPWVEVSSTDRVAAGGNLVLGATGEVGEHSASALVGDAVIKNNAASGRLLIQTGDAGAALTIDATNRVVASNAMTSNLTTVQFSVSNFVGRPNVTSDGGAMVLRAVTHASHAVTTMQGGAGLLFDSFGLNLGAGAGSNVRSAITVRDNGGFGADMRFWTGCNARMTIEDAGNVSVSCNLSVNQVLYLNAGTANATVSSLTDAANSTNTYIAFGAAGANSDGAYLRQVGGDNQIAIALDFQDDGDGQFLVRGVNAAGTDTIFTRLAVANDRIGINTATPTQTLDVVGGPALLRHGNSAVTGDCNQILLGWSGTDTYRHAIRSRHESSTNSLNAIDFQVWNTGQAPTAVGNSQVMSLTPVGVGIFNTAPTQALSVTGAVAATVNMAAPSALVEVVAPRTSNLAVSSCNALSVNARSSAINSFNASLDAVNVDWSNACGTTMRGNLIIQDANNGSPLYELPPADLTTGNTYAYEAWYLYTHLLNTDGIVTGYSNVFTPEFLSLEGQVANRHTPWRGYEASPSIAPDDYKRHRVDFKFPGPVNVTEFGYTSLNDSFSRSPNFVEIYGSVASTRIDPGPGPWNETGWTLIGSTTFPTFSVNGQRLYAPAVNHSGRYTWYRIKIMSMQGPPGATASPRMGRFAFRGQIDISRAVTVNLPSTFNCNVGLYGNSAVLHIGAMDSNWISCSNASNLHVGAKGSITLNAGGAERVRVNSTGNVAIGTSSTSTTLNVGGFMSFEPTTQSKVGLFLGSNWEIGKETDNSFYMWSSAQSATAMRMNNSNLSMTIGDSATGASKLRVTQVTYDWTPPRAVTYTPVTNPAGFEYTAASYSGGLGANAGTYRIYSFPSSLIGQGVTNLYSSISPSPTSSTQYYEYTGADHYSRTNGRALTTDPAMSHNIGGTTYYGIMFAVEFPREVRLGQIGFAPRLNTGGDWRTRAPYETMLCVIPDAFQGATWTNATPLPVINWADKGQNEIVYVDVPSTIPVSRRYALLVTRVGADSLGFNESYVLNLGGLNWTSTPANNPRVGLAIEGDVTFSNASWAAQSKVSVSGVLNSLGPAWNMQGSAGNFGTGVLTYSATELYLRNVTAVRTSGFIRINHSGVYSVSFFGTAATNTTTATTFVLQKNGAGNLQTFTSDLPRTSGQSGPTVGGTVVVPLVVGDSISVNNTSGGYNGANCVLSGYMIG